MSKRALCLNCIDGRTQIPVITWIKEQYGADDVDLITEPGMDAFLANKDNSIDVLLGKVRISLEKNASSPVFVAGHDDCKGNPVSAEVHQEQVHKGVARLKGALPGVDIRGLWIGPGWKVEEIAKA